MAASRGRKITIVLVVLLVVILGVLFAADRVGKYEAEKQLSKQASQELAARQITSPSQPDASIDGFPFLTQVAGGVYHKITIKVDKPSTQGVTLDRFDVVATDVHAKARDLMNGTGTVTADKVTGTGALPWSQVGKLITLSGVDASNVTVSADAQGKITAEVPVSALGISVTLVVTGTVAVADGNATATVDSVTTKGGENSAIINALLRQVKQALTIQIKLPKLPYNLQVTKLETGPSGLRVTAVATHVVLSGNSA